MASSVELPLIGYLFPGPDYSCSLANSLEVCIAPRDVEHEIREDIAMARPRIFLADDHLMLVDAFRKLLESEFEIVGTAADGRTLVTVAQELKPDLIVIDLGLPLMNGIDAGQQLKAKLPRTKLLVITMNDDHLIASQVLRTWASGYLLKKSAGCELIQAIREILAGRTYVSEQIKLHLQREFVRDPNPHGPARLTPRQREVLQLLAEGCSMKEAAHILELGERTVAFHKYRIMNAFDLSTNLDLLKLAIRENLVSEIAKESRWPTQK
jgi:DNA-binding NarL/FixJ family response regulator